VITDSVKWIRGQFVWVCIRLLSDGDRTETQAEILQFQEGITQTIKDNNLSDRQLLNENSSLSFLVGTNSVQNIDFSTTDAVTGLDDTLNIDVNSVIGAQNALREPDNAKLLIFLTEDNLNAIKGIMI
jgi:flagellin-like hook-associated protein FlgL